MQQMLLQDPDDFCRHCYGEGRFDDGDECHHCFGHGCKTVVYTSTFAVMPVRDLIGERRDKLAQREFFAESFDELDDEQKAFVERVL